MQISQEMTAQGHGLLHLSTVDSTMEEARRQFTSGVPGPLWIVADEQTGGRGRQGRSWTSPPGNLHTTLLMPAPCPVQEQPRLGFVAGVALQTAIGGSAKLKWPNDVLVGGAKVAGLLLEGLGNGAAIAIGMGVNITSHPADTPYPATHLGAFDPTSTRDDVLQRLATAWTQALHQFLGQGGFSAIRHRWMNNAAYLGEVITVRQESNVIEGVFRDIDPGGYLLLDTATGLQRIAAGDVFPLDK